MVNEEKELTENVSLEQQAVEALEHEVAEVAVVDYTGYSKEQLVEVLEKQLEKLKEEEVKPTDFRLVDTILKEVKPLFDQVRHAERAEALQKYVAENETEEGFEIKSDETSQQFDSLYKQIRESKAHYFQAIEKGKEKNFALKTELLKRLRELIETEESSSVANKANLETLRKIQDEWKAAGNVASPNNNALWEAYHALIDRFYSNRSIYFELLDLDRKKNLSAKIDICEKAEKLATLAQTENVTGEMLDRANALFEEFRHIGPATRETQEALWQRFKEALDAIYVKRREQLDTQKAEAEENYKKKAEIAELAVSFASFTSTSISEWNERTKALMALQDQWNQQKGFLPREKGKEVADAFWGNVKMFYRNKSEFFRQLEAQREDNLKTKTSLCEEVESYIANAEDSPEKTNRVIQLQKDWRTIGFVPEKFKDSIFDRFKKACDGFFEMKRSKNATIEAEFEANLVKKQAICERLEIESKTNEGDIDKLNVLKSEWNSVGFVPRKDMQTIQKRFNSAVNQYISAMGKVSSADKEKMKLENEVAALRGNTGNTKNLLLKESDIRRKMQTIENDIALWKNNIEFFAKSKTTEKLRADFEKKIERAERELDTFKQQLKIVRSAEQ
jgi:Domain of Unknown Function (DUF349)